MSYVHQVLEGFGEAIGIPGLEFDEHGLCSLAIEGLATVNVLHDDGDLVLFATLMTLPSNGGERILRLMLQANLLWRGTHGATLALDPETQSVVIQQPVPAGDIEPARFRAAFDAFMAAARALTQHLHDGSKQAPDGPGPERDELPAFSIRV